MVLNGTELLNNPWDTIFSPFTDIFGQSFWLFPLTFITVALFVKTRDPTITGLFMTSTGALFGTVIFADYPEMGMVYYLFAIIGLTSTLLSLYFMRQ